MTMKISRQDWETLSAYVDGELSKRATTHLEKRLQSEPALQIALQELERTQNILRHAPRLSAPRDFRLTPEMVEQAAKPRQTRLFSAFRTAAVLTSVLLVAVLVLDFGGGILQPKTAMAPLPMQEEALEAPQAESRDEAEPQGEVIAIEVTEISEEAEEEVLKAAPAAEEEMPPEEPQAEAMVEEEAEEVEAEKSAEAAGAGVTDDASSPSPTEAVPTPTVEQPTPTQPPPTPTRSPQPARAEPVPQPGLPLLRILEIVFGLAVAAFGAAAWLTKRKGT